MEFYVRCCSHTDIGIGYNMDDTGRNFDYFDVSMSGSTVYTRPGVVLNGGYSSAGSIAQTTADYSGYATNKWNKLRVIVHKASTFAAFILNDKVVGAERPSRSLRALGGVIMRNNEGGKVDYRNFEIKSLSKNDFTEFNETSFMVMKGWKSHSQVFEDNTWTYEFDPNPGNSPSEYSLAYPTFPYWENELSSSNAAGYEVTVSLIFLYINRNAFKIIFCSSSSKFPRRITVWKSELV